ncbi:RlpA-like double-psi beta-barrel-protein domain-containing protein-containing protein [Cladochytrium replicatum]|nr:RlpA-like double-psi beta-barrel-protein domain-containing protein-containing protein [Cladochytrium replicatum]
MLFSTLLFAAAFSACVSPSARAASPFDGTFNGRLSYYGEDPAGSDAPPYCGQYQCGACGRDPAPAYYNRFAALSTKFFDGFSPNGNPNRNPLCNRCLEITCNDSACVRGAKTVVQLVDSCPPCPNKYDLDVSKQAFADLMSDGIRGATRQGLMQVSWREVSCNGQSPAQSPKPSPRPSPTSAKSPSPSPIVRTSASPSPIPPRTTAPAVISPASPSPMPSPAHTTTTSKPSPSPDAVAEHGSESEVSPDAGIVPDPVASSAVVASSTPSERAEGSGYLAQYRASGAIQNFSRYSLLSGLVVGAVVGAFGFILVAA